MPEEEELPEMFEDDVFLGHRFDAPDLGTWTLERKLSSSRHYVDDNPYTREAKAVFVCKADASPGDEAIVKVFLRVPSSDRPELNARKMSEGEPADYSISHWELGYISKLITQECRATVSWASLHFGVQNDRMPFSGEFIGYLMMQKLPGQSLLKFYDFPRSQRDRIREAFKEAIDEVHRCGVYPYDTARRNLVYDEEQNKCYIVDFEDCGGSRSSPANRPQDWGLYVFDEKTERWVDPDDVA